MNILIIRDKTKNFEGGIKKHCYDLYTLFQKDKDIYINDIIDIPSKYIPVINKHIVKFKYLENYIKNSNCDIIHIHGFISILVVQSIIVSHKLNKKIIYSPHFHPFKYISRPFLGKIFYHLLLRPLLKKIETIVTINNEDTTFFSSFHHNVIKTPHWLNKIEFVEKVPRKKNMILFVGRNDSNKGLEHLYSLPKNKYEIHCVTGGILKREDFIQHKNISNKDLGKLYREAGVVVVPSRYEAFSLVALEALFNHTPIVISDRVKIGDYLRGKKGCIVFPYHDFHKFEIAIEKILQETNIEFDSLLAPFSSNRIKEKYKRMYLDVYNR